MARDAVVVSGLLARIRTRVTEPASLRAWTAVANDGIIATAGILEGFAGAGAGPRALLIAATAATVAGMLAAGGTKWSEVAAERDAQLEAIEDETAALAARPQAELDELIAYYEAKGLSPTLARDVAAELTAHDALAAQLESEHGILGVTSRGDALVSGIGASLSYAAGAVIPLVITFLVPADIEVWAIVAAVIVSLVVTSFVAARTGHMDVGRTVARTLIVGIGTLAISFAVGRLVF